MDVLVRIFGLQEQHLCDDEVGGRVVDGTDQETTRSLSRRE